MFSEADRAELLEELICAARGDASVVAAAVVGSVARGEVDRWSDIDLALRLKPGLDPFEVALSWTELVGRLVPLTDHLDVWAGPALYRVFLLENSLQVDLSFWPYETFASTGEPFDVLFGEAADPKPTEAPDLSVLIGWAWLYALHARSAIARGRNWQALQMIDGLRGQLAALACVRHGLPPYEGRGVDRLPEAERAALLPIVPVAVEGQELARAFRAAAARLLLEAGHVDERLGCRLAPALEMLQRTALPPSAGQS